LILKTAVISLDTKKQEIKLSDGRTQKYSFLVLATGTTVRKLSMDIDPSACAYSLFDLEGAEKIKDKKSEYHSCLVIGGGFIGLELAASLRTAGLDITLLVASERILSRTTAKETAAFITQVHSRHGVNIITGGSDQNQGTAS
jgi:3-phenylpropionate/trans-cinnamate dioxygenase ferredoxin reductase subunit